MRRNVFRRPDEGRRRKSAMVMKMTMARIHIVAIAAGLLLAASGPGVAAKRTADTKNSVKTQSRAAESRGSANAGSPISRYSRDDPYAPGVNWPGKW
jgi:hypothetical protein